MMGLDSVQLWQQTCARWVCKLALIVDLSPGAHAARTKGERRERERDEEMMYDVLFIASSSSVGLVGSNGSDGQGYRPRGAHECYGAEYTQRLMVEGESEREKVFHENKRNVLLELGLSAKI